MLIYATSAELTTWLGVAVPANAADLLRSASLLVRRATLTAIYDVDAATSLPTDADLVTALREATCSQVATWIALAIDPVKGFAEGGKIVSAKSLGSGSIQYAVDTNIVQARADAARYLSQDALLILAQAGLTGSPWELG